MDCNKEEAIMANEIAESKMLNKDFSAARKIALKAQRFFENLLDDISQMLLICDVHCAAEQKLFGSEMDWYGILKVESTIDDINIKKQYTKFALQLHPDINKFPGAEAAFKLIGKAQRLLLDQQKRHAHDIKRKAYASKPAPHYSPPQNQSAAPNPTVGVQNNFNGNFTNVHFQHPAQSAAKPGFSNGRPTFWTACPFCNVRFLFHIEVLNKSIICQSCNKPFSAYERSMTGNPLPNTFTRNTFTRPVFPQKKDVPNQTTPEAEPEQKGSAKVGQSNTEFFQKNGSSSEFVSENVNRKKRKKQDLDTSESCTSNSSSDESEAFIIIEKDGEFKAATNFASSTEHPRRSDEHKQNVSYKEHVSDDQEEDHEMPSRKTKRSKLSFSAEEAVNGFKDDASKKYKWLDVDSNLKLQNVKGKEKLEGNGSEKYPEFESDTSSESKLSPVDYEYPDPEFNDFDKDRQQECFKAGQIWAVYDSLDAMPRWYARIMTVRSNGFKVKMAWLKPDPDDEDKLEWIKEGLPVSCGKFSLEQIEIIGDRRMFSHLMSWENGGKITSFKIIPKKGEIWALFNNLDINRKSDASNHQGEYEYEHVEILSDYTKAVGVFVACLAKVSGFVSLFHRICHCFLIKPDELYRFSHNVPSFKLTGNEKNSVPKGYLELDPAALPRNIKELSAPKVSDAFTGNIGPGSSFRSAAPKGMTSDVSDSTRKADANGSFISPDSSGEDIECPESEFFDFDAAVSSDKFVEGQIWALYRDEDGLPKYYGKIVKVDMDCDFKVGLRWLIALPLSKNMIHWHDKEMPICCGKFVAHKCKPTLYTSANSFSHQVMPATIVNGEYTILPKYGEVWALYKNWSSKLNSADLKNHEYSIAEVVGVSDGSITVSFLERIDGFNSVFKAQAGNTESYQLAELLRFSHQIPAFRLTGERNGSLRGFWELDSLALPVRFYKKN